jgi:hypothetical protein
MVPRLARWHLNACEARHTRYREAEAWHSAYRWDGRSGHLISRFSSPRVEGGGIAVAMRGPARAGRRLGAWLGRSGAGGRSPRRRSPRGCDPTSSDPSARAGTGGRAPALDGHALLAPRLARAPGRHGGGGDGRRCSDRGDPVALARAGRRSAVVRVADRRGPGAGRHRPRGWRGRPARRRTPAVHAGRPQESARAAAARDAELSHAGRRGRGPRMVPQPAGAADLRARGLHNLIKCDRS